MKVKGENILVSGSEIHELTEYGLSRKLDGYLSEELSFDLECYQDEIAYSLELCMSEYYEVPLDYVNIDVPQDRKNFRAFIRHGKRLRARAAASLLEYLDADSGAEHAESIYRVPRDYAEEIAIHSIYQVAKHTFNADNLSELPVIDLSVYREVQNLPTADAARLAWARRLNDGTSRVIEKAYYTEMKRKKEEEAAGNSLDNAHAISSAYGFSLADAVRKHIKKHQRR